MTVHGSPSRFFSIMGQATTLSAPKNISSQALPTTSSSDQPVICWAPVLKEVMMPSWSKVTTPSATALMIRSLCTISLMSRKVSTPPTIWFSSLIKGVALILTGKEEPSFLVI